ncbi:MAG: cupredoxin domain-containing protein [Candidatus Marsarchaeota archaeon]|nr:cupredoxin domain-containing protein [Candidatus Marsarchaeota archaeon]
MRAVTMLLVIIAAAFLVACVSAGTPTPAATETTTATGTTPATTTSTATVTGTPEVAAKVQIINFTYQPATVTIKVGQAVEWTQEDASPHTVTSTSTIDTFDSGNLNQGQTYVHQFNTKGTFRYVCSIHPNMEGTVVVE